MNKNIGFAIGAAVIILIGLAGWRYNHTSKNALTTDSEQQSVNSSNQDKKAKESGYLEIKELGVKFKLPDDMKDVEYSYKDFPQTNNKVAYFSTKSLRESDAAIGTPNGQHYCIAEYGPIGALSWSKEYATSDNRPLPPGARDFGSSLVYFSGPQSTCSLDKGVAELQSTQIQILQKAIQDTLVTLEGNAGKKFEQGVIEGSLSYPSEGIPSGMWVCAENQSTKKIYCTQDRQNDTSYTNGIGYKLFVPAGQYHVWASMDKDPREQNAYRAYYNKFVTCGTQVTCKDHTPIVVNVGDGKTVASIDPGDWYNRQ